MNRNVFPSSSYCNFSVLILASCWIVGLIVGAFYSLASVDSCSSLMRMLLYEHVSIVCLFVNLFPVCVICLAAKHLIPYFSIFVAVLLEAFIFSFCLFGINAAYGTAGWLIYSLLSFSMNCTMVPFIWFSLRAIHGFRHRMTRDLSVYLFIYFAVIIIDSFCVSPYLAHIMTLL